MYKMKILIISIITFGVLIGSLFIGVRKQEYHECLTWKAESEQYGDWVAQRWQYSQCRAYSITLPTYKIDRM